MMFIGIGILLTIIGGLFKLFPPKKINSIYGYRTKKSMINQDVWNYSQKIGANSFIITAIIFLLIGLIANALNLDNELINIIIFVVLMIVMIIIDEKMIGKFIKRKKTNK